MSSAMTDRRRLLGAAAAAGLFAGVPFAAAFAAAPDAKGSPDEWVLAISNKILEDIRSDAKLSGADPARVQRFVDEQIMPTVDFERMTRTAVGPKWRQATKEQRAELMSLFREQLIRVYSGALASVKDQTVKLAPNRVKPTATDALVRTLLVSLGKPDLRINYRLKKVKGEWRIIDVDVEGIWIVDNYRTQFSSVANQFGIDGLIKTMRERNAEAAKDAAQ